MQHSASHDPLGILASTAYVVDRAGDVRIDQAALDIAARQIAGEHLEGQLVSSASYPTGKNQSETANLILVLDALNFCFWPDPGSSRPRWQVTWQGVHHDGYDALVAAMSRSLEDGMPLADADFLAGISLSEMETCLAGDDGCQQIPLFEDRVAHVREVGRELQRRWNGSFLTAIRAASGSAASLIRAVTGTLSSFNDVARYNGRPVVFHKRAQILIADLAGVFGGQGPGKFADIDILTAFADYKVPQVLRQLGILSYSERVRSTLRSYELIPPGSRIEVEIRAATVQAVELLRRELAGIGTVMPAYQIDHLLWQAGQSLPGDAEPYHRTLTGYY